MRNDQVVLTLNQNTNFYRPDFLRILIRIPRYLFKLSFANAWSPVHVYYDRTIVSCRSIYQSIHIKACSMIYKLMLLMHGICMRITMAIVKSTDSNRQCLNKGLSLIFECMHGWLSVGTKKQNYLFLI